MTLVPLTLACMTYVAAHTDVTYKALRGLRETEHGQVGLVTRNVNKAGRVTSVDIGPFQINDVAWVPYFTKKWKQPSEAATFELLRDNGCANALAAGTVFHALLLETDGNYGKAVGLYNAPNNQQLAQKYRERFLAVFLKLKASGELDE